MVFTRGDSFLSPEPQSPPHHTEADDTVNYSQYQREPSVPEGDLFLLSIMSPLPWVDGLGEQSFIHNPADGPFAPVHSSTPLHVTGEEGSDGYQTSTRRKSPYSRQSRSRSPPSSQRGSWPSRNPTRTPSPAQAPGKPVPTDSVREDAPSPEGMTLKHILFSLNMAEASQGHWCQQSQDPALSFQQQCQAHTNYVESNRMVRYYTALLQHSEASAITLQMLRSPITK
ncbi:MAG: hypothetical protein BYD32DRAFT_405361 [Podila humilis]|nr:MAG: hypothetical protein BYD32DRAFT_409419 [Podila humilis]KAI9241705.1 MAG: hypothetical protein BYD32DRAFT_405361 [Podila humilis]